MLQLFEQHAKGEKPDSLVYSEVVEEGGDKYFRFLKAIIMPPVEKMPCLNCHGEN